MGMVLMGMSFFENYSVTLDVKNHLVHLPDISMQVRKKSNNNCLNKFIELQTTEKTVIPPFHQVMVPVRGEATYAPTKDAVEATPAFEGKAAILVSPALVTLTKGKTMIQITNPPTTHLHLTVVWPWLPHICT